VPIELRDVTPADLPAVVDLNRAAVDALSEASLEDMAWFARVAVYFKVAVEGDALLGFLIAFTPHVQGYPSENYRWFQARYDDFVYVDRVVVAEQARGRGLGRRFYEDLERFAQGRATRITCEVYLRPRNDGSLRFHAQLGFHEVGTLDIKGGTKTVSLLCKPVSA
jgi:predicted GNAT superfamily acetyltransferase